MVQTLSDIGSLRCLAILAIHYNEELQSNVSQKVQSQSGLKANVKIFY